VVLCTPAPDVLSVQGVIALLSEEDRHIVQHVGYDKREALAVFYDVSLREPLKSIFIDKAEIWPDEDRRLELIALQAAKRPDSETCAVVAHALVGVPELVAADVHRALAARLGPGHAHTVEELAEKVKCTRHIDWRVAQMVHTHSPFFFVALFQISSPYRLSQKRPSANPYHQIPQSLPEGWCLRVIT
jgi:hypothetical protein